MKKRLPWIGMVLVSLCLLFFEFFFGAIGFGRSSYFTFIGIFGVIYGGYKIVYPDKKDKGDSE